MLEHLSDPMATDRGIDLDRQAGLREVIDDRQQANPPALLQDIQHEVQRPALVRPGWHQQWRPRASGALAPAPSPYRQPLFLVEPVELLFVHGDVLPFQHQPETPVAEPTPLGRVMAQPLADVIVTPIGPPAQRLGIATDQPRRAALAHA